MAGEIRVDGVVLTRAQAEEVARQLRASAVPGDRVVVAMTEAGNRYLGLPVQLVQAAMDKPITATHIWVNTKGAVSKGWLAESDALVTDNIAALLAGAGR